MNPELAANLRVIYGLFARIATPMIWTLANPTGVIGGRHSHLLLSPPASGGAYPARQFHRDPHTAAALRELAEDHLATAESGTALDKIGPTSKGIKSPLRPLFPSLPAQAPQ